MKRIRWVVLTHFPSIRQPLAVRQG